MPPAPIESGPELAKRSRVNTRARLIESSRAVFAEHGFQAASIADLCAAAGFTRGAFYSNFETKDELFLALWDEQATHIVSRIALVHEAIAEADLALDVALDLLADHELYDRDWFVLNTEFLLHALRDPAAAAQLARHRDHLRLELGRLVEAVVAAEGLALDPTVDIDSLTRVIIAGHEGCQNQTRVEVVANDRNLFRTFLALILGPGIVRAE